MNRPREETDAFWQKLHTEEENRSQALYGDLHKDVFDIVVRHDPVSLVAEGHGRRAYLRLVVGLLPFLRQTNSPAELTVLVNEVVLDLFDMDKNRLEEQDRVRLLADEIWGAWQHHRHDVLERIQERLRRASESQLGPHLE